MKNNCHDVHFFICFFILFCLILICTNHIAPRMLFLTQIDLQIRAFS